MQETGFAQVMSWYTDCTSIYKFLWQNCIPKIVTKPDAIEIYTYPAMILSIHIMCMACFLVLSSMAALVITNLYRDTLKLKNKINLLSTLKALCYLQHVWCFWGTSYITLNKKKNILEGTNNELNHKVLKVQILQIYKDLYVHIIITIFFFKTCPYNL